jgi:tetratricopeptide (TPR) repeat protein
MLKEFGEDRTTAEVFQDVLHIPLADYDRKFEAFVEGIVGDYKMVPRWDDESLKSFLARTEKDPDDVEAWVRLGWARLQRRQTIDAGTALERARKLDPDHPEVVLLGAYLAEQSGRKDLAREGYDRFLGLGEDDLHCRMFLAEQAMRAGDGEGAIRHLEAAKTCFPTLIGKGSPYLALAKLYEGSGRLEDAIREYEAYTRVAGEDYAVRKKLLKWYEDKGDQDRVAELCREMIEITPFGANPGRPPDLELHREAARAFDALGDRDKALRELEVQVAIVGLLDEDARVQAGAVGDHLALGRRYLEDGRPLDALSEAAAALRLSPDDAKARILKGEAEEAAGYR